MRIIPEKIGPTSIEVLANGLGRSTEWTSPYPPSAISAHQMTPNWRPMTQSWVEGGAVSDPRTCWGDIPTCDKVLFGLFVGFSNSESFWSDLCGLLSKSSGWSCGVFSKTDPKPVCTGEIGRIVGGYPSLRDIGSIPLSPDSALGWCSRSLVSFTIVGDPGALIPCIFGWYSGTLKCNRISLIAKKNVHHQKKLWFRSLYRVSYKSIQTSTVVEYWNAETWQS